MRTITTIPFTEELTEQQIININSWLVALRSGEYKQAYEGLSKDGGFCCLGVCSAINSDATLIEYENRSSCFEYTGAVGYSFNFPDLNWMEKNYGFHYDQVVANVEHVGRRGLAWLNDARFTFETIADVIENVFIRKQQVKITEVKITYECKENNDC